VKERELLNQALDVLRLATGLPEALAFEVKPSTRMAKGRRPDAIFIVQVGKRLKGQWDRARGVGPDDVVSLKLTKNVFVAEVRLSSQPRYLRSSISFLKEAVAKVPRGRPLIVTPYIGPAGRELCRKEGVSYVDTVGNVGLFLEDGFVVKESSRGLRQQRREMKSLFSPKATRVLRILLENPDRAWGYQELADAAKVSLGQAYNVVRRQTGEEYVGPTKMGVKVVNPAGLLDRWASAYAVTRDNTVESFYSDETSYRALLEKLAGSARRAKSRYAFTLFAGASLVAPFVRTPQVHLYVLDDVSRFAETAGLKPVTSGGNVHLIRPYDEGVLNPMQTIEGLSVVGNVQLYLDLVSYPARGKEQAEVLRSRLLRY
jgi:hypothetical protein